MAKKGPIDLYDMEDLHAALLLKYGAKWVRLWEHIPDTPKLSAQEMIRQEWLQELARFPREALWYGLKNIPADNPPNAMQFAAACRGHNAHPEVVHTAKRLDPPPKQDAKRWRETWQKFRDIRKDRNPLAWAYDLRERHKRGDTLTEGQIHAYRAALTGFGVEPTKMPEGHFTPIDESLLPLGMCSKAEQARRAMEGRAES